MKNNFTMTSSMIQNCFINKKENLDIYVKNFL